MAFAENSSDIRSYYAIHQLAKGNKVLQGHLATLDKAMFMLISALWESYCEDVASEALELLAEHVVSPTDLPKALKREVVSELGRDKNELAVWKLADNWRSLVKQPLSSLRARREWVFNSPKADKVDEFFAKALGLEGLSNSWISGALSAEQIRTQLDAAMGTRGEIAHRGLPPGKLRKLEVKKFFGLVQDLVDSTDLAVGWFLMRSTNLPGWP